VLYSYLLLLAEFVLMLIGTGGSSRSVGMISLRNGGFDSAADTSFFPAKAALPDAAFFLSFSISVYKRYPITGTFHPRFVPGFSGPSIQFV
jgi:hypothetical protein